MTTRVAKTRPLRVFGISVIGATVYFVAILYVTSAPRPLTTLPFSVATVAVCLLAVIACGLLKYFALRINQEGGLGRWLSIGANAVGAPIAGAASALFYWSVLLRPYA